MITYETESSVDIPAREALLDRVMGPARFAKPSQRLRAGRLASRGLSLVARDGSGVVGTVRLWDVMAEGTPALLLGPLAVAPETQGKGVGASLMRLAIARAGMLGHGGIILVGDPEYYARFGFSASWTGNLEMPAPVERRRFLGLELAEGGLAGIRGEIVAAGAFAPAELIAA